MKRFLNTVLSRYNSFVIVGFPMKLFATGWLLTVRKAPGIVIIAKMASGRNSIAYNHWLWACSQAEDSYFNMLDFGCSPQEARSVLPNSLKTEVVMTANIREWRHFLKLRCSPAAHPQMREVALILLEKVHALIPVCFDDIWGEYHVL